MNETGAPARRIRLALITGLSGSGRSSVAKCLEDLRYYCVDNLPLPLLRELLARPGELIEGRDRIAVVADVRTPGFEREFPAVLAEIDAERFDATLVFLEASDEVLIRRFSETRRPHPLAPDAPPSEGIRRERLLLGELRERADLVLDTSEWSIHEVRSVIHREFSELGGNGHQMLVSLISFGFKFGIPYGSDLLFDVRFLPNPYFVAGLRERTGREPPVQAYLDAQADFPDLLARLRDLLVYLLPRYQRENRSYLSIAIGCTGGRHRSVAVAERLAAALGDAGWSVQLLHRDVER
ncbi:MAG: RNase adapter RapZ [Acidobacteria bacterium]|nr:RNase adapter RapZ [Thermoanaerobaculia bacterium]NLN10634.1 RNase adapter RapZ [Acidobacteriota bacterium]MBP7813963.1 RNase adapter RapZ [Thermoanaerobaculia bacterium]MBP8846148.1 RNase adapter RapZ [Thermoanaerobaculia bacterium]HNU82109.1 RNase adapter RapZ [Thermoanaerobaculia bacterium]